MVTIKQGLSAIAREDQIIDRRIAVHQKALKAAIWSLEEQIILLFDESLERRGGRLVSTQPRLVRAQQIHAELLRYFDIEYNQILRPTVQGFDIVARAIETRFRAFEDAYSFAAITYESIEALKNSAIREFETLGAVSQEKVAKALYEAVIVGSDYTTLKSAVRSALTGRYSRVGRPMVSYANQMTHDQIMSFHTNLNLLEAERAGINTFLYYGDVQTNTRSFCRRRVGKIYSREQIEAWTHKWDGKAGPPLYYRGGYNCRHIWVPARREWFKNNEEKIKKEVRRSK